MYRQEMNRKQEVRPASIPLQPPVTTLPNQSKRKIKAVEMLQFHATHTPHAPHQTGWRRATPPTPPAGALSPPNTRMLELNGPVGGWKAAPESMSVQVEATPTQGRRGGPRGPAGVPETPVPRLHQRGSGAAEP